MLQKNRATSTNVFFFFDANENTRNFVSFIVVASNGEITAASGSAFNENTQLHARGLSGGCALVGRGGGRGGHGKGGGHDAHCC